MREAGGPVWGWGSDEGAPPVPLLTRPVDRRELWSGCRDWNPGPQRPER